MIIRRECEPDFAAIEQVVTAAFGQPDEAKLVQALRDRGLAPISLVAERDGQILGHVLFSPLAIHTSNGIDAALALAPLAVLPECQRQGIGSQLVRQGLEFCRSEGWRIVIVLGDPAYYGRFGFSASLAQSLESPYAGPSFQALDLRASPRPLVGRVVYAAPFNEL